MSTLQVDPNVVDEAVARLTDMYRDKPVVLALTETCAERCAAEEALEVDLYQTQWIDNATGELLDAVGEIVGEAREGRSDNTYRLWIKARVTINRSNGQVADSYHLIRLVAVAGVQTHYELTPPAAYLFSIDNTTVDPVELVKLLRAVKPAGVRMNLLYDPGNDVDTQFTYADAGSLQTDWFTKGYGSTSDSNVGGRYRGVL